MEPHSPTGIFTWIFACHCHEHSLLNLLCAFSARTNLKEPNFVHATTLCYWCYLLSYFLFLRANPETGLDMSSLWYKDNPGGIGEIKHKRKADNKEGYSSSLIYYGHWSLILLGKFWRPEKNTYPRVLLPSRPKNWVIIHQLWSDIGRRLFHVCINFLVCHLDGRVLKRWRMPQSWDLEVSIDWHSKAKQCEKATQSFYFFNHWWSSAHMPLRTIDPWTMW